MLLIQKLSPVSLQPQKTSPSGRGQTSQNAQIVRPPPLCSHLLSRTDKGQKSIEVDIPLTFWDRFGLRWLENIFGKFEAR